MQIPTYSKFSIMIRLIINSDLTHETKMILIDFLKELEEKETR